MRIYDKEKSATQQNTPAIRRSGNPAQEMIIVCISWSPCPEDLCRGGGGRGNARGGLGAPRESAWIETLQVSAEPSKTMLACHFYPSPIVLSNDRLGSLDVFRALSPNHRPSPAIQSPPTIRSCSEDVASLNRRDATGRDLF
ncbi:hypothetical protein Trydic_g5103 [Trypoxylus dichotomus]